MRMSRVIAILVLMFFMLSGLMVSASDGVVGANVPAGATTSNGTSRPASAPSSRPAFGDMGIGEQTRQLESEQKKLWEGDITAIQNGQGAADLRKAIDSLRAVLEKPIEPRKVPTEPQLPSLEEMTAATSRPATATQQAVTLSPQQIADALEFIKKAGMDNFKYPLLIADKLYGDGNRKAAAVFYDLAARSSKITQPDKSWAIFQIATCLEDVDLAAARAAYAQLMTEMPKTELAQIAKFKDEMLKWRLENNLKKMKVDETIQRVEIK